jgi:hypothetical protein
VGEGFVLSTFWNFGATTLWPTNLERY